MKNKTLIGKEGYLFLQNDECNELLVHCKNLDLIQDKQLKQYKHIDKTLIIIYPNKSLIYKEYLPDGYNIKYRPGLEIYKKNI